MPDTGRGGPHWSLSAACRAWDTELFYAPVGDPDTRTAKAVCRGCPVLAECLETSLARAEPFGVWGGLNEDERLRLVRRRRTAKRKAVRESNG